MSETLATYTIPEKVRVDIVYLGEGRDGDYDPDDPEDVGLVRFDAHDLTGQGRSDQDASYCTSIPLETPGPVLNSVCEFIAKKIVDEPHWKRILEELSWTNRKEAEEMHNA